MPRRLLATQPVRSVVTGTEHSLEHALSSHSNCRNPLSQPLRLRFLATAQPRIEEPRAELGLESGPVLASGRESHIGHRGANIGPRGAGTLGARVQPQKRGADCVGCCLRVAKSTRHWDRGGRPKHAIRKLEAVHAPFEDLGLHVSADADSDETLARGLHQTLIPPLPHQSGGLIDYRRSRNAPTRTHFSIRDASEEEGASLAPRLPLLLGPHGADGGHSSLVCPPDVGGPGIGPGSGFLGSREALIENDAPGEVAGRATAPRADALRAGGQEAHPPRLPSQALDEAGRDALLLVAHDALSRPVRTWIERACQRRSKREHHAVEHQRLKETPADRKHVRWGHAVDGWLDALTSRRREGRQHRQSLGTANWAESMRCFGRVSVVHHCGASRRIRKQIADALSALCHSHTVNVSRLIERPRVIEEIHPA